MYMLRIYLRYCMRGLCVSVMFLYAHKSDYWVIHNGTVSSVKITVTDSLTIWMDI